MRAALAWLARTGLIYLLLFAAIAFFVFAWPSLSGSGSGESLRQDAMSVEAVRAQLSEDRDAAQAGLVARVAEAQNVSDEALDARRDAILQERAAVDAELANGGSWLDSVRPSRILAIKRLELRRAALSAELTAVETAREGSMREAALRQAEARFEQYRRIPTTRAIALSQQACTRAEAALDTFDDREQIDRAARNIVLQERAAL
ncbi:MAG: hypothetical protein WBA68_10260, partial [Alteraurantiacibacter sp.]